MLEDFRANVLKKSLGVPVFSLRPVETAGNSGYFSLNIAVSVCHVSGSKVNRKERSRPSLFVCFCVPPC